MNISMLYAMFTINKVIEMLFDILFSFGEFWSFVEKHKLKP